MDKFKMLEDKLHDLIIEGKYVIITADLFSIIRSINTGYIELEGLEIPDFLQEKEKKV